MMKEGIAGFALALALSLLSAGAGAGVAGSSTSRDYAIGTLEGIYQSPMMTEVQSISHIYTFDIAEETDFSATFIAVGQSFLGGTDLSVFDSHNKLLYPGFSLIYDPHVDVSLMSVRGHLPAGEEYYFRVTINHSPSEYSYQFLAATPVPESETYAMFLAGLGLLVWRLRNAGLSRPSFVWLFAQNA